MLSQDQANKLIEMSKRAVRDDIFVWASDKAQDEAIFAIDDPEIHFVLSLKRHPFKIRLHFRTKDRDIGLARVDNKEYHRNPDGTEIRGPHLHLYREGHGLDYAQSVDWFDANKPERTLESFLKIIHTKFVMGYQVDLF